MLCSVPSRTIHFPTLVPCQVSPHIDEIDSSLNSFSSAPPSQILTLSLCHIHTCNRPSSNYTAVCPSTFYSAWKVTTGVGL